MEAGTGQINLGYLQGGTAHAPHLVALVMKHQHNDIYVICRKATVQGELQHGLCSYILQGST